MDNKYEYDEDDDFWYNQESPEEEIIEDIADNEVKNGFLPVEESDIPVAPSNDNLDFNHDLPDVFKEKEENLVEKTLVEGPVIEMEKPIEVETPVNESNSFNNVVVEQENKEPVSPPTSSSFFGLDPELLEKIDGAPGEFLDSKPTPLEMTNVDLGINLSQMPDLGPADDEDEDMGVGGVLENELQMGIIIVCILIAAIFGLPWLYNLIN